MLEMHVLEKAKDTSSRDVHSEFDANEKYVVLRPNFVLSLADGS